MSYLARGLAQGLQSGLSSYRQTKQDMAAKKEREEEMAWRNEQRDWQRSDRVQKDQLRTSLADAAAPARVDQGIRVTDAAGSDAFTKDADAAAMMGDMVSNQRPSLASATRVQDKAYSDPEAAKKAEAEYNDPNAKLNRMGDAAMGIDPQTGLSLKNAATTQRKQQFEMDKAMREEANEKYNLELTNLVNTAPNWWDGAAEAVATSASLVLPPGSSVKPALSADGKKVDMIAVSPDGDERVLKSFPADDSGKEAFLQQSMKADPMQQIKWLSERVKREYEKGQDQEKHKLTLAEIRARGEESRNTAGYRDSLRDGAAGGPKPLNSMERMLIDGRRSEALKELRRLEEATESNLSLSEASLVGEKSKHWPKLQAHQKRIEEARAEYQRWNSAMEELATAALDRQGLGSAAPTGAPAPQAGPANSGPVKITSQSEYSALPKGTRYTAPDGSVRIKQ